LDNHVVTVRRKKLSLRPASKIAKHKKMASGKQGKERTRKEHVGEKLAGDKGRRGGGRRSQ